MIIDALVRSQGIRQEIGLTSCLLSIAQLLLGNEEEKNTNAWSVSSGRMRGEGELTFYCCFQYRDQS